MNIDNHYLDLMVAAQKATNRAEAIELINQATKLVDDQSKRWTCNTCGREFINMSDRPHKEPCCYCRNMAFDRAVEGLNSNNPAHASRINQAAKNLL